MFDVNKLVEAYLNESLELAENQKELSDIIKEVSLLCIKCIDNEGKLILFGNGGSASDSQHIAAELVGRFQLERKALPAISLSSNISVITALANDFGYEIAFYGYSMVSIDHSAVAGDMYEDMGENNITESEISSPNSRSSK